MLQQFSSAIGTPEHPSAHCVTRNIPFLRGMSAARALFERKAAKRIAHSFHRWGFASPLRWRFDSGCRTNGAKRVDEARVAGLHRGLRRVVDIANHDVALAMDAWINTAWL